MTSASSIQIAHHVIGDAQPPFVIAEMSGNHNQSLATALQIVDAAAQAGAHALKIQTYTADTMTIDLAEGDFFIRDPDSLWAGTSLYNLYQQAYTPWEWHAPIFARARSLGMIPFSTPFDPTAVDFLESLDVACYKIASFEMTDLPLIKTVASTGKPMIISTGMATVAEIDETVRTARAAGCKDLILLKCTSTYPAAPSDSHLNSIPYLQGLFGCQVGLSDHTLGIGVALASVALGARVIEKHFTLCRADGGVDSVFSLEPNEMSQLVSESERVWMSLGKVSFGPTTSEEKSIQFRRSLYVITDLEAGETLSDSNVRAIRPGFGLPTKHYDFVLGKRLKRSAKRGTPLSWDMLD